MTMKSLRYGSMAMALILLALGCCASAQLSTGGAIVYMGDLSLVASSMHADEAESDPAVPAMELSSANNTTLNATASDNSTINMASEDASDAPIRLGAAAPASTSGQDSKGVLDLSGYAKGRVDSNLTGYTNIMYPITGSRGTTASTSSGGGCCGGG